MAISLFMRNFCCEYWIVLGKCLHLSGLTPEQMNAYDDAKLKEFGIGFTNIVERTSRGSADLTKLDSILYSILYSILFYILFFKSILYSIHVLNQSKFILCPFQDLYSEALLTQAKADSIYILTYLGCLSRNVAREKIQGIWIWGFPLIWDIFLCIFRLFNRNGFLWGGLNPESPLNMPPSVKTNPRHPSVKGTLKQKGLKKMWSQTHLSCHFPAVFPSKKRIYFILASKSVDAAHCKWRSHANFGHFDENVHLGINGISASQCNL